MIPLKDLPKKWEYSLRLYYDSSQYEIKSLAGKLIGKYDSISFFNNKKIAKIWRKGKLGFIDDEVREIAPCIYKGDEPLFGVKGENGKYGFIDKNGSLIVDFKYDMISTFQDESAMFSVVFLDKKIGIINREGKQVLACKYDEIKRIGLDGAFVTLDNRSYWVQFQ